MILLNLLKFNRQSIRFFCSKASSKLINESLIPSKNGNLALVSLSKDIYHNLALEQYIADNYDFQNRNVLLLWQNEPCVVIGRYQNSWQECNLVEMKERRIKLARRASGGGCVYHDLGNLNCTFFTTRDRYNRQFNLKIIKNALEKLDFKDVKFHISPRHDIFFEQTTSTTPEQYKISGTSSRISKNYSYHHCTVLFNVDLRNMGVLKSNLTSNEIISSRGTASVRSKCKNLAEFTSKEIKINDIVDKLANEYWSLHSQPWSIDYLYNYINPEELDIQSTSHYKEFTSWEYIYGHTPKFQLKLDLSKSIADAYMVFFIENGAIANIDTANLPYKYLDQFTTNAHLFHNRELKRDSILEIFRNNDLLKNRNKLFQSMYDFFEKHFI